MTLAAFIRKNRPALDAMIRAACPNIGRLNDRERRLWIANDYDLYQWARAAGVRFP